MPYQRTFTRQALLDWVSNTTPSDSLFLHDGFGSLNGDTLEVALTALDSRNASGKMFGIIRSTP